MHCNMLRSWLLHGMGALLRVWLSLCSSPLPSSRKKMDFSPDAHSHSQTRAGSGEVTGRVLHGLRGTSSAHPDGVPRLLGWEMGRGREGGEGEAEGEGEGEGSAGEVRLDIT